MKKIIIFLGVFALMFSSCQDLIDPAEQNFRDVSQFPYQPDFAAGMLLYAYRQLPGYYNDSDYATDDAVTNNLSNAYLRAATGAWAADNNPTSRWNEGFAAILHINLFLEHVDNIQFIKSNEDVNKLMRIRMKGEAYGLRALHMYHLLRLHAGYTDDGRLLGVPIITEFQDSKSDFNQPRATFEDCIKQIYADLDLADEYLPWEYNDIATNDSINIPARFQAISTNSGVYNRAMGKTARQLFNGLISSAVRSKVSLLAASEAFQSPSDISKWAQAANDAAKVINSVNGVSGLASNGLTFYANQTEINGLTDGLNPPEIIWREEKADNTDRERDHFPPSLNGTGRMNPTQNLVDAFPMANGYPITDVENSGYNPATPYTGRDPRLDLYIIRDGSAITGAINTTIRTGSTSGTNDALNHTSGNSTRTGYFMKKTLRFYINRTPGSVTTGQFRYIPRIRHTEIFLNYAEAANEAWGPTGTGDNTYSAYDVIKAIRRRAGLGGIVMGDPYLESIKNDKDKMRELIRNERRLELCFEGFRFWDLRRWKQSITEPAKGIDVSVNYTPINVEVRNFQEYMHYGPIPYSEVIKYSNLLQNKGW